MLSSIKQKFKNHYTKKHTEKLLKILEAVEEKVLTETELQELEQRIKKLLKKGADINAEYSDGDTPLVRAYRNYERNGYIELFKLLLQHGANPNAKLHNANRDNTILICETRNGLSDVVKLLLVQQYKTDVNAKAENGCTALIYCAAHNYKKIAAQLLLQPGIDVNAYDNDGNTALHWASRHAHTDIVQQKKDIFKLHSKQW